MKSRRKSPYTQFNFLVNFGGIAKGGFSDCSGLNPEIVGADSGAGSKEGAIQKITGLNKSNNITLKRGIVDSQCLDNWLNDIRDGSKAALRTVLIHLQNEHHSIVQKWKLTGARIIKHTSGPMNAKGTDVAMEELTLSYERLEME